MHVLLRNFLLKFKIERAWLGVERGGSILSDSSDEISIGGCRYMHVIETDTLRAHGYVDWKLSLHAMPRVTAIGIFFI